MTVKLVFMGGGIVPISLKKHCMIVYTDLLTSGKLHSYLVDINEQATDRLLTIMEQMKKSQGLTEELKDRDMMAEEQDQHGRAILQHICIPCGLRMILKSVTINIKQMK